MVLSSDIYYARMIVQADFFFIRVWLTFFVIIFEIAANLHMNNSAHA